MGYILPSVYKIFPGQPLPSVFIETGTYKGGIAHRCMEIGVGLNDFEKWYTIEIDETICKIASKRFKYFEEYLPYLPPSELIHTDEIDNEFDYVGNYFNQRLTLFCGDSAIILSDILEFVNEPCCFWLDAHAGSMKYGGDPKNVPLFRELEIIKNHPVKNHIIAIDDVHLFGTDQNGACDYTNITKERVANFIRTINSKYDVSVYAPFGMEMIIAYVNE